MRIIRPATIDEAALVSSTVPETAPAAYDATATYAKGTRAADLLAHRVYESAQNGNVGHALTDTAWWLDAGPTNRWRMFDQSNSSQTEAEDSIQVDLQIAPRVNSLALLNIEAASAQIIATVGATEVYNRTFELTSTAGISDWYSYFFEEIVRKPYLIVTDMPNYSNMAISVILERPGGIVRVGVLVVGQTMDLGVTLQGLRATINDFSRKETDDFGTPFLRKRASAKLLDARDRKRHV